MAKGMSMAPRGNRRAARSCRLVGIRTESSGSARTARGGRFTATRPASSPGCHRANAKGSGRSGRRRPTLRLSRSPRSSPMSAIGLLARPSYR